MPPEETPRLSIEAMPRKCRGASVRNLVSARVWQTITADLEKTAHSLCEICDRPASAGQSLICHEQWRFIDEHHVMQLVGLIVLCVDCYNVKQFGLSRLAGQQGRTVLQIAKVNRWTIEQAERYRQAVRRVARRRNRFDWRADWTFFKDQYGNKL